MVKRQQFPRLATRNNPIWSLTTRIGGSAFGRHGCATHGDPNVRVGRLQPLGRDGAAVGCGPLT